MKKKEPYQRVSILVLTVFVLLNLLGIAVKYSGFFARAGLGFTAMVQALILALPTFLYRRIFKVKKKIHHTTGYRRKSRIPFAFWATILVASLTFLLEIIPKYVIFIFGGSFTASVPADSGSPLSVLVLSVLPVIFEEYLFRGTVLTDLTKNLTAGKAILISSFYFALLHGDAANLLAPFAAGLLLGIMVFLLGSVKYAIVAHLTANFLTAGLSYAVDETNCVFFMIASLGVSLLALYFTASAAEPLIKYDILKENIDYFNERLEMPVPLVKASVLQPTFLIFVALFIVRVVTGL